MAAHLPGRRDAKDGVSPRRLFFWLAGPLLLFRLWFAAALPITGDEAYFVWWGKIPDWGFYDHPPMVGWWLAAQLAFGDAVAWLRLTAVLQPFALAAGVLALLPRIAPGADPSRRWWAALLVLLSPAFVWNVLITTDTPLIYFSVFSGLCWLRARRDDDLRWYLLCGVLLAGAVLSKYFVAFLGFAYLVDLAVRPGRRAALGLLLAYLCCVPALALMVWWNADHCWPNYMFNFVNRHGNARLSWQTPLLYAGMMVYLLTPPVLWALAKRLPFGLSQSKPSADSCPSTGSGRTAGSSFLIAVVPLALFGALSLEKTIGLHWVLSFLPFALLGLALVLPERRLRRIGLFCIGFAALHAALIVGASFTRLDTWQKSRWYESVVLAFDADALVGRLQPHAGDYVFASNGYADAVVLGYHARRYFAVFGEASSHARHDDILTDFRALDGKNILILRKGPPREADYAPYFEELKSESFVLDGVTFYEIFGRGFRYAAYRDTVLTTVRDKYYRIPRWLPQRSCYFHERYWPEMPWPPG